MSFCSILVEQGVNTILTIYHNHFYYIKAVIKLASPSCEGKINWLINADVNVSISTRNL